MTPQQVVGWFLILALAVGLIIVPAVAGYRLRRHYGGTPVIGAVLGGLLSWVGLLIVWTLPRRARRESGHLSRHGPHSPEL